MEAFHCLITDSGLDGFPHWTINTKRSVRQLKKVCDAVTSNIVYHYKVPRCISEVQSYSSLVTFTVFSFYIYILTIIFLLHFLKIVGNVFFVCCEWQ